MDSLAYELRDGSKKWKLALLLCLIGLPIAIFYLILFRTAVNLPILDDYQNILGVAIALKSAHSLADRLAIVLLSQNNGYKLVFESAVVWIQYSLLGRVLIWPLVMLGNAIPILIFSLVIAMARRQPAFDPAARLLCLLPVACILFQLQYASALNFASISLQQLAVVAFTLLTIYLLCFTSRNRFALACVALALAVAASPNAFFLAPVGILVLVQQRRWKRITVWIAAHAVLLAAYLYRYAGMAGPHAAAAPQHRASLLYALSFLGASGAGYSSALPSVLLGVALLLIFAWAIRARYFRMNPAVFYSMLFVLITGFAVAVLRGDQGVLQSLASRYRIYSNLMLALAYIFLVESRLPKIKSLRSRRAAITAAIMAAAFFCSLSDLGGARYLSQKKAALILNYRNDAGGELLPTTPQRWMRSCSGNYAIASIA